MVVIPSHSLFHRRSVLRLVRTKLTPLSIPPPSQPLLVFLTNPRHTYQTANSRTSVYESAQRLTRPATSEIDGVGIVAILEPKDSPPLILLQKQFRPPIDKICIEVPAGLMDEGETAEECALRELKEETGYIGEICGGGFGGTGVMWNGSSSFFFFPSFRFCPLPLLSTSLRFLTFTLLAPVTTLAQNKPRHAYILNSLVNNRPRFLQHQSQNDPLRSQSLAT
jgi:8-oxo-dGTP pyrophosphatase MutT (NUDIX family)